MHIIVKQEKQKEDSMDTETKHHFDTVRKAYEFIFRMKYNNYHNTREFSEDKSNRLANIDAIQNAWLFFNEVNYPNIKEKSNEN